MKYLFIVFIAVTVFSCSDSNTENEKKLQATIDSLVGSQNTDKDAILEYYQALSEIEYNLRLIKQKENIISLKSNIEGSDEIVDVEGINDDITMIYKMMQENKEKLEYLQKRMSNMSSKNKQLIKQVDLLAQDVEEKTRVIDALREELEQKNIDLAKLDEELENMKDNVSELTDENIAKSDTIEEQDKLLHTAYYVIGTNSDLKDKGIVTKEGGFIGIGGVKRIHKSSTYFIEIDIREKTEINLKNTKKVTLLSNHPKDSYEIVENDEGKYSSLDIKNPGEFWSLSKYLVIIIR